LYYIIAAENADIITAAAIKIDTVLLVAAAEVLKTRDKLALAQLEETRAFC
jgi:hypothetical protein